MKKSKYRLSKKFWDDDKWALANYGSLVKKYPDKWIAVVNKQVVAYGDGIDEVRDIARKKTKRVHIPVLFIEGKAHVY
jgi:hypothetical protein